MIPIQNVYYMLAYAFQVLNEQGYKDVAAEQFDNTAELFATILVRGVSIQLKRGMNREYIEESDALSTPRGKLEISESLKNRSLQRKQLICTFDDFSVNSYPNRIIKTTMELLLHSGLSIRRRKELRNVLVYLNGIECLDIHTINWNVQYHRNNQSYRMLISICYLVVKGLLQTQSDGTTRLMEFVDEQRMCHLYEKFILEYFRKEHPEISANASQIPWQLDNGFSDMLPILQTDIMLTQRDKVLIIDAKYYSSMTQEHFDVRTVHSDHLNQIFTYVKNKEAELKGKPHIVSGMILYAKTDEDILLNHAYQMSGNSIVVRTLDLNCDFAGIRQQLDAIAKRYFETESA